jgi:hypothetical protein
MSWSESSAESFIFGGRIKSTSITLADFENFGEQEIAKP